MHSLINFFLTPSIFYENGKAHPPWVVPWIVVIFGLVTINWLTSCIKQASFSFQIFSVLIMVILISSLIFILWSFISIFLYFISSLFGAQNKIHFMNFFSITSYCGLIFLIGEVVNFILIQANLLRNDLFALPHRFPIGLDIFTIGRNPNPILPILLYCINPFTLWYLIHLSMGLQTVTGLSKAKARSISCLLWLMIVGFVIGILLITGGTKIRIRLGT
jgi:hypothetical protein